MKIGILSETHGKTKRLKLALSLFAARGVDAIVHCGDIGAVECIEMLGKTGVATYAVLGNMDRHPQLLIEAAQKCGVRLDWEVVEVPLGDGEFLVATHGHDEKILDELIHGQQFPYVCCGHTHRRSDKMHGKVRVINPGALHHSRKGGPSFAILDTKTGLLEFIEL